MAANNPRKTKATPPVKPADDDAPIRANVAVQEPPSPEAPPDPWKQRSIPELDLYLFNIGEYRRAHRLLGAHLVEGGVRFAVWAPNARRVSVVGSFNDWNRDAHPMERRGNT